MSKSKDKFIEDYCYRSHTTWDVLKDFMEAIPCDCGDDLCEGWQMVNRPRICEIMDKK